MFDDKSQFGTKTKEQMDKERELGELRTKCKKLYVRLSAELQHYVGGNGDISEDLKREGHALATTHLKDGYERKTKEADGVTNKSYLDVDWGELLKEIETFEAEKMVDYRERVKKYQEANGGQDAGKKEKFMNKQEFLVKYPLNEYHHDKEGSAFYIKDYIESTGEVVIALKLNGTDFKEKIIPTVAEFEKLIDEAITKKEKTLKEIFEPQPGGAKQNKQEAGNQKKYATETEYKNYLEKEFGALNQPHTDDEGVSLYFEKYSAKNDLVQVSIVGFEGNKRFKKKLSREAFEEFIRRPVGSRGTIEALFNLNEKNKKAEQKPKKEKKEADAEKPEEEPEMSEEEKKSAEELEKEKVVADARNAYAKINFEVENAYARIKKILGEKFGKKPQDVPDVAEQYGAYQEKLKELREFKMNALRDKYLKLSPEERKEKAQEMKSEMEQLVTYFNYDEKIRLYESRTNAGAEAQKDNIGGKILAKSAEWVNRYRKMGWKKKLLISGALIGVGVGATMLGATTVGFGVGFLKISQRALGGAVAGVGTAGLMETLARKSQKKEAEAKKKAIFDEFEVEDERNEFDGKTDDKANWEEKLHAFETRLDEEINSYAKSLKSERGSVNMRLIAGLGVTAIIATGGPGYLMKWGLGLDNSHGNFHWLSDKLGITKPNINLDHAGGIKPGIISEQGPIKPNIPPIAPSGQNAEQIFTAPKNINTEKLVPGSVKETLEGVEMKPGSAKNLLDVNFKKGDSIEKVLIQKMTDPQGMNLNKAEAGKLAHRMALQYAKEKGIPFDKLNHVQIGDKITFDLEHQKLVDLERMHKIPGHTHMHAPRVAGLNPAEHLAQEKIIPTSPLEVQSNMPSGGQALREAALQDEMMRRPISGAAGSMMAGGVAAQKYFRSTEKEISKNARSLPKFARAYQGDIIQIGKLKDVAEEATINLANSNNSEEALRQAQDTREAFEKSYVKVLEKISKDVFIGENVRSNLDSLKSTSADDYLNSDEGKQNPKIINLMAYARKRFGEKFPNPKANETVPKWAHRMNGKILEDAGLDLKTGTN